MCDFVCHTKLPMSSAQKATPPRKRSSVERGTSPRFLAKKRIVLFCCLSWWINQPSRDFPLGGLFRKVTVRGDEATELSWTVAKKPRESYSTPVIRLLM